MKIFHKHSFMLLLLVYMRLAIRPLSVKSIHCTKISKINCKDQYKTQIEHNDLKSITEAERIQEKAKKQKMLFITSSVAATGNAVKFLIGGKTPEAINLPQWIDIVMQSIKMIKAATRNMTYERLAINRKTIDAMWQELLKI